MTSQSGRGLVLICMERGLVNNGIALILGFFRNLSRGSHEFFQTPKFVGYLVVRWIWAVKDLYGDGSCV